MAAVLPFKALRPAEGKENAVSTPPYDVIDYNTARKEAAANPISFLHVGKAEVDIENLNEANHADVYKKAAENLNKMIENGILVEDEKPYFYIYRLASKGRSQTGIAACTLIEEYLNGTIKKHELTRPEKEKDRMEHIKACRAHTGPVFMAYRSNEAIKSIIEKETASEPEYSFTSNDGVTHTVWVIKNNETIKRITDEFKSVDSLYIADGHHRSAAAADVYKEMKERGSLTDEAGKFLSVIFPDDELNIMGYHRMVKDLNGLTEDEFIEKLSENFYIMPYLKKGPFKPLMPKQFGMLINNRWYILTSAREENEGSTADNTDAAILYNDLLSPVLGIGNIRTDKRISFVGGKDSVSQLELSIILGQAKVAFTLYPTSIEELMAAADEGEVMPPKSTWFEPKLRSGLFVHRF